MDTLDYIYGLAAVIGIIICSAGLLGNVIIICESNTRNKTSKKYEPIPGVRYTPHWYLKDPLPRNVKPKEITQPEKTSIQDSGPDNLHLLASYTECYGGTLVLREQFEKVTYHESGTRA